MNSFYRGVDMEKMLYVINPAGNGGAGLQAWGQFKKLWNEPLDLKDIIFTERPAHAIDIASNAEGYTTIVSVGGDGTVNEVIQGILQNKSTPALALIPAGTGNDVGRNVGIRSVEDAVNALQKYHTKKYDVIQVVYGTETKYSFLCTNFGFSANHRITPWMKRLLGPTTAYYLATFLEIVLFRPWDMTIEWESGHYRGKTTIVINANVEKTSGGSMMLGPGAAPTDGKMTVTIVPFISKYDCLVNKFPKTPTGDVMKEPGVEFFQAQKITIDSHPPCDMDIDGDIFGPTPATLTICPQAVQIVGLGSAMT